MNRLFSVRRRRPHIVDLFAPVVYGVDGYRVKWAQNFDDAFNTIITSTNVGYLDRNVNRNVVETQPTNGTDVRIVFDPTSFTIDDSKSFWLQFVHVIGGVEQTPGAPTLVLPDAAHWGITIQVIQGEAPGTELQLDLPKYMEDVRFINHDGANNLFVGTEEGGPKLEIPPNSGEQSLGYCGSAGSLYVQGDGAPVQFSAAFTLAFPR